MTSQNISSAQCQRCGECCKGLPLSTWNMHPSYRKYLLERGLKEDQGFILIPHTCQHLKKKYPRKITLGGQPFIETIEFEKEQVYICAIHDSPDRPEVCRKFHGQKKIGPWSVYVPPGCAFRKQ